MKLTYNWLKEFAAIDSYSPGQIADILLSVGFEVAGVIKPSLLSDKIITAEIITKDKHPNADRLSLCKVSDGKNEYQIVCGASNMLPGDKVVLALSGTLLPGGLEIKKASIRNVESEGMLCSEKELGFSGEIKGIIILPKDTVPGKMLNEVFYLDDVIYDIEIYPNRSDCLGVIGIARELSAKLDVRFKLPEMYTITKTESSVFPVEVMDQAACPRYTAAVIKNVEVKESPLLIKTRLKNCGLRPINNIVDITNYVMLEIGQPLHAFDLNRLSGKKIIVRSANENEKIAALNDVEYKLDASDLVIADDKSPCAVAGVIGGRDSAVITDTKEIVLESAVFERKAIRKTRKKLNLNTDSSYRFERGTGWDNCDYGSRRAISLILQHANAWFVGRHDVFDAARAKPKKIILRRDRLNKVLNTQYDKKEVVDVLVKLGMQIELHETDFMVEVPSHRLDINDEIDLIEDVARIKGYDTIPVKLYAGNLPECIIEDRITSINEACRNFLFGQGFDEAVNYSFSKWEKNLLDGFGKELIEIENPLSAETQYLRPSLFPGLAGNLVHNLNNQFADVKFFETGKVFWANNSRNVESDVLGIICTGNISKTHWKYPPQKIDYFFISGVVTTLLKDKLLCKNISIIAGGEDLYKQFVPGRSITIKGENGVILAAAGLLKPEFCEGVMEEVYYAEVYLENLKGKDELQVCFSHYINLPASKRDLSILAPKEVQYSEIEKEIRSHSTGEYELGLELFDIYEGGKIPENMKSLSFKIFLKHKGHTLSDDEMNKKIDDILASLSKLGVSLRTV